MKIKSVSYCIALIIFLSVNLYPQDYRFENYTSDDGLSQNSVVRIFQDSRHFLWFGTYDGLNRFDGYSFKVYKSIVNDSTTINGQYFSAICEDKDGNLWIGSLGGGLNKYIRSTDSFKRYKHNPKNNKSLSNDKVRALLIDRDGNLWIGTEFGLDRYDPQSDSFVHYRNDPQNPNSLSNNYVLSIGQDASGKMWIGTFVGLNVFDFKKNKFSNFLEGRGEVRGLGINWANKIFLDRENNLWIGTTEGLHRYDEKNDRFIRYIPEKNNPYSISEKSIRDIIQDANGNLWIATTHGGLNELNPNTGKFKRYIHDPLNRSSLTSNFLISLWEDNSGLIWIGTDGNGIDVLDRRVAQFNNYKNIPGNKHSLSENKVYSIYEDIDGLIWIGTMGGGLNRFDPKKKHDNFTCYLHDSENNNSIVNNSVRYITGDKNGMLWLATETGLDEFNPRLNKFYHYNMTYFPGLKTNAIFSVLESKNGDVWVGTYDGGLSVLDKNKKTFRNYLFDPNNPNSISSNVIRCILEDNYGHLWFCTDNGLDLFDSKKDQFIRYVYDSKNPSSISSNSVLTIYQDKKGTIWVGTTIGLNKIEGDLSDPEKIKFVCYTKKDGLADNDVQGILEDNHGNLWISTNAGISKFNPEKLTFKNYTTFDGLPSNEFYVNANAKRKETGELLFAGDRGFCIFNPDSIKDDQFIPPISLTDLHLFNKSVGIGEKVNGDVILSKAIWDTKEITLSYKNNILMLDFAALDYSSPHANQYAYLMEGLDKDWNNIGTRHTASFMNLPPGEYNFKVRCSNASGLWNYLGASIKIIVLPPYWMTWWFRGLAVLFLFMIGFVAYKLKIRSMEKRRKDLELLINEKIRLNDQLQVEITKHQKTEIELRKAKEEAENSNRLKSEFLAQISHEIRSPLNIAINYASIIREELKDNISPLLVESIDAIDQVDKRVIRTIDLVLNMSEMQLGTYLPSMTRFDIVKDVLNDIINQYSNNAKKKLLEIFLFVDSDSADVYADRYSVTQIFANLIDNAIKYTDKGKIEIWVKSKFQDGLTVSVKDTGIGISEEYLPKLFEPFSQEEHGYSRRFEGNGLGLALVKKYCDLNGALITVSSKKGEGSTFSVIFNNSTLQH